MHRTLEIVAIAAALGAAGTGCSTWDSMSTREKATVGGAAVGVVIGDQLGKERERR
jgi:osmotically inducible lipoprotein OsmB